MRTIWARMAGSWAVIFGASLTGCAHHIPQQYAGRWLLRTSDANLMLLTTEVHGTHLRGELTRPKHFIEQADGSFVDVISPVITRPLSGTRQHQAIALQIGEPGNIDRVSMVLLDPDHLSLDSFQGVVPAWKFERVRSGEQVTAKTDWPAMNMDPQVVSFRERLQSEAEKDKGARNRAHLDDEEMAQLASNALPLLNEIFTAYGWPSVTAFGVEAETNFWLLVQHQELDTQKRMLGSLEEAVSAGQAPKLQYAYLFDRVQVLEEKPQHWGTQSRCEHGHAVLYSLDASSTEVDERRKAVGLEALNGKESENLCERSNR